MTEENFRLDPFMITENFSQIFGGLIGVYARLITKEKARDTYLKDGHRIQKWHKRLKEMEIIKTVVEQDDFEKMERFNNTYRPELLEMINLEADLVTCGDHNFDKL